jgi:hypothetical protein
MNPHEIQNCDLERIYRINYYDFCGFVPGRNTVGEQILMGVLENELLVALFFSEDGHYLRYAFWPILDKPDPSKREAPRRQLGYILQSAKQKYAHYLGMTPGPIHIRHFAFPDWGIGIAEWPWGTFDEVRDSLARTGQLPDDEFIREWKKNNRWVLHWKKEYWMNEDGEIGDT